VSNCKKNFFFSRAGKYLFFSNFRPFSPCLFRRSSDDGCFIVALLSCRELVVIAPRFVVPQSKLLGSSPSLLYLRLRGQ